MTLPVNEGNLITRRAFTDERGEHADRLRELHKITGKSGATCYKYTQPVGFYGSGLPSPLFLVIESVRVLHELDEAEGCKISFAQEFAEAPLLYLNRLRGEISVEADPTGKLKFILKWTADANYLLGDRDLKELPPGDLQEFSQLMLNASSSARELGLWAAERAAEIKSKYPGAPTPRERPYRVAGGEG